MTKFKNMKQSHKIAVIVAVITTLWMLSGALSNKESIDSRSIAQKEAESGDKLQTVRVMDITSEQMIQNVSIAGKTKSHRTVTIKSETSGRVESIDFSKGAFAKEGTSLISLAVDERKSTYEKAMSNLQAKKINYEARLKLQEKKLTSNSAVALAKSELEQATADVESAKLDLEHTKIKSPFNGIIEDRFVEVGDYVGVGTDLAKIVDLNPIKAVGYLSENIRENVKVGSNATVILSNKTVQGKITYIASSADEATRTYKFEVAIPNEDNKITEGLTCTIRVDVVTLNAHSISPALIVLNDVGEIGVMTVTEDNIVKFIPANFLTDENERLWLNGLPDNFTIITVGHEYVKDGTKVITTYENKGNK
ncbi:MAG: efflux RND transporter periplasmic adaptor subunit [Alphaproteobacteria bacterium]|jgi:multidrug efflux system membrane fusion protein|nr:efflux RND transporter periplasmic adaptor subunit [Alphaproteobacteria bacterium]